MLCQWLAHHYFVQLCLFHHFFCLSVVGSPHFSTFFLVTPVLSSSGWFTTLLFYSVFAHLKSLPLWDMLLTQVLVLCPGNILWKSLEAFVKASGDCHRVAKRSAR